MPTGKKSALDQRLIESNPFGHRPYLVIPGVFVAVCFGAKRDRTDSVRTLNICSIGSPQILRTKALEEMGDGYGRNMLRLCAKTTLTTSQTKKPNQKWFFFVIIFFLIFISLKKNFFFEINVRTIGKYLFMKLLVKTLLECACSCSQAKTHDRALASDEDDRLTLWRAPIPHEVKGCQT